MPMMSASTTSSARSSSSSSCTSTSTSRSSARAPRRAARRGPRRRARRRSAGSRRRPPTADSYHLVGVDDEVLAQDRQLAGARAPRAGPRASRRSAGPRSASTAPPRRRARRPATISATVAPSRISPAEGERPLVLGDHRDARAAASASRNGRPSAARAPAALELGRAGPARGAGGPRARSPRRCARARSRDPLRASRRVQRATIMRRAPARAAAPASMRRARGGSTPSRDAVGAPGRRRSRRPR